MTHLAFKHCFCTVLDQFAASKIYLQSASQKQFIYEEEEGQARGGLSYSEGRKGKERGGGG